MSLRAKKKHRKPFVVTVMQIAATALVPGCVTEVTTNPPAPSCPATLPGAGDPCVGPIDCDYGDDGCGNHTTASCNGNEWSVMLPSVSCNPPPPPVECPVEPPVAGDMCTGFGDCTYTVDLGCGAQVLTASCYGFDTGFWEVTPPMCDPPPVINCASITVEADCATQPACRWLTPGCDTPPLPQAACFPATDCVTDMDCTLPGQACMQVSIDPCYGKACDACAMMVSVCLTP